MRHGGEAAFSELFDLYWGALCTFGERITGSIDLARDIVQDVMIRFWELRESVTIRTSVRAYLYSAVRNRAIHHIQHDRVVHRTETFFAMLGASPGMGETETTEDVVARHELAIALDQVISHLPPRTRQVALLKWGDQLSRTEIAQVMGTRPFTVDKQITAATRAVRAALEVFLSENSSGE
jgi:RNA polymerase sigma-70 factor (ECF subfamily)